MKAVAEACLDEETVKARHMVRPLVVARAVAGIGWSEVLRRLEEGSVAVHAAVGGLVVEGTVVVVAAAVEMGRSALAGSRAEALGIWCLEEVHSTAAVLEIGLLGSELKMKREELEA